MENAVVSRRASVWPFILTPVVAALVLNGIVFALGWNPGASSEATAPFAPPGWVVGGIWVVLLGLMGVALWRVTLARASSARVAVVGLIVACLAYPLYTSGLRDEVVGLVGCLATFGLAAGAFGLCWRPSRTAAWSLAPTLVWLVFATAISTWSVTHRG